MLEPKQTTSIVEAQKLLDADIAKSDRPGVFDWRPTPSQIYYSFEDEVVKAKYEKVSLDKNSPLSIFLIRKYHYKNRMDDIVLHMNYFLNFYDLDKESFMSTLSIKFIVDSNQTLSQEAFRNLILNRLVTPSFIGKCKMMAADLYSLNINTDSEGKFKSSPKITNAQARQIVALSFCYRIILPLCIHYTNISLSVGPKTGYLKCFDKLFVEIMEKFEKDDTHVYTAICKFAKYRVDEEYNNNKTIWHQKKQLRGDTPELYLEDIIHEVVIVKTIYKLDYRRSCVSFIDGVIHRYNINYRKENYTSKPYEIDSADSSNDNDDYLSHGEALEMASYKIDESNMLLNDVNIKRVLQQLDRLYGKLPFAEGEFNFYYENVKINSVTQFMLHSFYSRYFHDSYAIYSISRTDTVKLMLYMKKYLQLTKMPILAQIVTAKIQGKYRDVMIKNTKFVEKLSGTSAYQNILRSKYQYLQELDKKDDPIIKKLSGLVNSTFEFVDFDPEINGFVYDDIDIDEFDDEFTLFLSII